MASIGSTWPGAVTLFRPKPTGSHHANLAEGTTMTTPGRCQRLPAAADTDLPRCTRARRRAGADPFATGIEFRRERRQRRRSSTAEALSFVAASQRAIRCPSTWLRKIDDLFTRLLMLLHDRESDDGSLRLIPGRQMARPGDFRALQRPDLGNHPLHLVSISVRPAGR